MTDEHSTVHPLPTTPLPAWVEDLRYASLTTFRADGSPVATPVWFAHHDGALLVRTPTATAKVRRVRARPNVELRPCDWRGRAVEGAVLRGRATVLDRAEGVAAEPVLRARYGWRWNVVPVIPLPGVQSAHRGATLRRRLRLARADELWAESSILRIEPRP